MSHDTVGSATYDPDADALYVRLSAGREWGPRSRWATTTWWMLTPPASPWASRC